MPAINAKVPIITWNTVIKIGRAVKRETIRLKLPIKRKPIHTKAIINRRTVILDILKCLKRIPLFTYTIPKQSIIKPAIEIIKTKSASGPALVPRKPMYFTLIKQIKMCLNKYLVQVTDIFSLNGFHIRSPTTRPIVSYKLHRYRIYD